MRHRKPIKQPKTKRTPLRNPYLLEYIIAEILFGPGVIDVKNTKLKNAM